MKTPIREATSLALVGQVRERGVGRREILLRGEEVGLAQPGVRTHKHVRIQCVYVSMCV